MRMEEHPVETAPKRKPRQDWEAQFKAAGSIEENELLLCETPNEFDAEEWQW
jgi:hypothetical protein